MPYAKPVASMIAAASFIVFDYFLGWLNVASVFVLLYDQGERRAKTSCLWYTCHGIYRRFDDHNAPLLGGPDNAESRHVIHPQSRPAATSIYTMSRQRSTDVMSVSSSPRSSTVSAITALGLADDGHQHLDASGGLDARPGQPYAPSEDHSEIEMQSMDHTPSGIEISTSNEGSEGTTTEERESLISPIQNNSPTGETAGIKTVEVARPPWVKRLGKMAIAILMLGTAIILGAVSFTGFLWFASHNNRTWHAIIVRDWLTESVTILAEAIKQAVNFQIGIGGAMLAALALERGEVLLPNAASLTMMRNGLGSGKLLSLSKKQLRGRKAMKGSSFTIPCLILLETKILAFIQAITIILTSDIGLQPIPGYSKSSETAFGFTYVTPNYTNVPQSRVLSRGTSWSRKASVYPTFAEYSEPPFLEDGVSDTGLTLRAFLPYSSAQDREDTYRYNGRTTVLDSRVTCQLPNLEGETVQADLDGSLYFTGSVRATRATPRLGNVTISLVPWANASGYDNVYNESVPFFCVAPSDNEGSFTNLTNQWRTTLCQLGECSSETFSVAGGLISEFKSNLTLPGPNDSLDNSESSTTYGTAYLMVNITKGAASTWRAVTEASSSGSGVRPPKYSTSGEWLDLVYSNGALVLSVTLCYSSFDTADLPVKISSTANRTETTPVFDFDSSTYTFDALREQYGQYGDTLSPEQRGVLRLDKQDWTANQSEMPPVEPYMRDFANLGGPKGEGNDPNYTALLWEGLTPQNASNRSFQWLDPDLMHIWLFQEIVQSGGSIAFALQSLITLLSSMAYYDQLGQFDNRAPISQTQFVTANTPQRYRGFVAVTTVLLVHLILLGIIVTMFLNGTRYSMLGNSWQSVSQAVTSETEGYLAIASMKVDDEVKSKMKEDSVQSLRIGIDQIHGSNRVGVVRYEDMAKRRSTKPNTEP